MGQGVPPAAADPREVPAGAPAGDLAARLATAGRRLGAREASHRDALLAAQERCRELHRQVSEALDAFHGAAADAGAPHLHVAISEPRLDDKHVRAVEFELRRGRHAGLVVVKTKGELTLVGPFRTGKAEGPCRSLPVSLHGGDAPEAAAALEQALGDFLERFLEEAATP